MGFRKNGLYGGNTITGKLVVFIVTHKDKIPNGRRQTSLLAEELNSKLPRTNPARGLKAGLELKNLKITIPVFLQSNLY